MKNYSRCSNALYVKPSQANVTRFRQRDGPKVTHVVVWTVLTRSDSIAQNYRIEGN